MDENRLHEQVLLTAFISEFLAGFYANPQFRKSVDSTVENIKKVKLLSDGIEMPLQQQLSWMLVLAFQDFCKDYLERYYKIMDEGE